MFSVEPQCLALIRGGDLSICSVVGKLCVANNCGVPSAARVGVK